MKNLLFLLLTFTITSSLTAQDLVYDVWDVVETTDEFGDKTGESVARYFSKGKFSNSATTGEDMIFKFVDYGMDAKGEGTAQIDFFEYNRTPATLAYNTELGSIKCKMPDGSIKTFQIYAMKGGGLALWGEYYTKFMALINNGKGEKIKFALSQSDFSDYGNSSYQGYFHTKSADKIK